MRWPGYTRSMTDDEHRCIACGAAGRELRRIYIRAPRSEGHGFAPAGWVCPRHLAPAQGGPDEGADQVGPDHVGIPEDYNPPLE